MEGKVTIYACKSCGKDFSFVEKMNEKVVCPKCGEKLRKNLLVLTQQG